jgi:hypothetical protein
MPDTRKETLPEVPTTLPRPSQPIRKMGFLVVGLVDQLDSGAYWADDRGWVSRCR